jgi:hypothetical protein
MSETGIRLIPRTAEDGDFRGFYLKGRRPDNVLEWAHATMAMAHFAVTQIQSQFLQPNFYAIHDDPLRLIDDTLLDIELVEVGTENLDRSKFGTFALGGCLVRIEREIAVGALLFPGAPHLGIGHTATVVHVDAEGTVHRMLSDDNARPSEDPDIAVLSTVLTGAL